MPKKLVVRTIDKLLVSASTYFSHMLPLPGVSVIL
jgi:hypothetical protein